MKIGLLGGTFDPIHQGHLHIARSVLTELKLDKIEFIPVQQPPHRPQPVASAQDRLAMLRLAIASEPQFAANPIELQRLGPSYTIDTLQELADPTHCFCLILGMDSFLQFNTWHHWQRILNYCHLIVVNRPGYEVMLPKALADFYEQHKIVDWPLGAEERQGGILNLIVSPSVISATAIRQALRANQDVTTQLPAAVYQYIKERSLYK